MSDAESDSGASTQRARPADRSTETDTEIETETTVTARLVAALPQAAVSALFLLTLLLGVVLAGPVERAGLAAFENPSSLGNVGVFAVEIIVATAVILLVRRFDVGMRGLRLVFVAVFAYLAYALASLWTPPVAALGVAVAAGGVLWIHPEWYVLDALAVPTGGVLIAMLGLGFGPLPIVVLLIAWAAYDAYSVYVSGHMQTLVGGLDELLVPMVYVVPADLSYSIRNDGLFAGTDAEDAAEGSTDAAAGDGGADSAATADTATPTPTVAILGLGDAIIPGMLAVSAGQFLTAPSLVTGLALNAPAIGALLGGVAGIIGLQALARAVDGVHAGLPVLNAGVLGGYLLGAVAAGVPLAAAVGLA